MVVEAFLNTTQNHPVIKETINNLDLSKLRMSIFKKNYLKSEKARHRVENTQEVHMVNK